MTVKTKVRVHRAKNDLARVVTARQVAGETGSLVTLDKENIALALATGQDQGFGRRVGLGDSKAGASIRIPSHNESSVPNHGASPLNLLDTIHSDNHFAPMIRKVESERK